MSMEPFDESGSNPACFMLAQNRTSLLFFFDDETISYLNDKRTKLSMKLFMNRDIFSRVLRDSTPRFVGPSVGPSIGPSVGPSHFTFFGFLRSLASLLLPK